MISNQVVASVSSVTGQSFARSADGTLRPLVPGESLYDGETLVVESDSDVAIVPSDGSPSFLVNGPIQVANAGNAPEGDASGAEMDPETVARMIEALQKGNLDDLPAPAAGPAGGSRGHDFVRLERVVEAVDPLGFGYGHTNYHGEGPFQGGPNFSNGGGRPQAPTPDAHDDYYNVVEGSIHASRGNVLSNDRGATEVAKVAGVDGTEYDVPSGGYVKLPTVLGGYVTIYSDGHFLYDAPVRNHADAIPDIDSFQYRAVDGSGRLSDLTTVHINITDTAPIAADDDYGTLDSNQNLVANVMDNDTRSMDDLDPNTPKDTVAHYRAADGQAVQDVYLTEWPASAVGTYFLTAEGGQVWIRQDGTFSYNPAQGFVGQDSFQYQLVDGDGSLSNWATVTMDIPAPPPPMPQPEVHDDLYNVVEGTIHASRGNILSNDIGAVAVAKVVGVDGTEYDVAAGGYVKLPTVLGGYVIVYSDGHFLYDAPVRNQADAIPDIDSFQYRAVDSSGHLSGLATVRIDVTDTAPVAMDDDYGTLDSNQNLVANVMDNDTRSMDDLDPNTPKDSVAHYRAADGQAVQDVYLTEWPASAVGTYFLTAEGGQVWIRQDGTFSYNPAQGFVGQDSFQYQLVDNDGSLSNWATVTMDIPAPPPPMSQPETHDDNYAVHEGGMGWTPGNLLANDIGAVAVTKITDPAGVEHDVLAGGSREIPTMLGGTVVVYPDGHFVYSSPVRDHNDNVSDIDSFQYRAVDSSGHESDLATVHIDILDGIVQHGGVGHDILAGADGAPDVFTWSLADLGNGTSVTNTVTHFKPADGDKLNLSDLLHDDATGTSLFDSAHLDVSKSGGSTTITVKPVDAHAPELTIVVDGVDLTGGYTGQDAINHMINQHTLDDK